MKTGIACYGNWIVDILKTVDRYPAEGSLAIIGNQAKAIGGGAANIAFGLHALDSDLPVFAGGVIGQDAYGDYILSMLEQAGIARDFVRSAPDLPTAYTDVYQNSSNANARTFFHNCGANSELCEADFLPVFARLPRLLYLGYLTILPELDRPEPVYGCRGGRALAAARSAGIETALDLVSGCGCPESLIQALQHVDHLIVNELEASALSGIAIRKRDETVCLDSLFKAATGIRALGVHKTVAIHMPEASCLLNDSGYCVRPSYKVSRQEIRGTVGAGDAFCCGLLYGLYRRWQPEYCLDFANANARFNLLHPSATGGAVPVQDVQDYMATAPKNPLP